MEVDEGGGGYGFARRNNQAVKKVGRRAAVHPSAPVVPASYAPSSQKPVWVWLLVGFLLGTGGTLLTASFWFPESGNRPVVAAETSGSPAPGTDGVAAATATELSPPEDMPVERHAETTPVAALEIESAAVTPRVDWASSAPGEASEGPPDRHQDTEAAVDEAASELLLPNDARDRDEVVGRQPIDGDLSTTPSDAAVALAALVSKAATETADLPSRPDGQSPGSASDRAERARPAADDAPVVDTIEDLSVARNPDAVRLQPDEAVRAELPPRIRQALRAARAEAQSATGIATGSSRRLYRVQLAAVDNEAAARVFWREVNQRLPGVFADVEPVFNQRLVDERLYLRIWVGAFENRPDADSYCGWLKLKGQDCFVTRVDNL